MKKKWLTFALAVILCTVFFAGCTDSANTVEAFRLAHFDGNTADGSYDSTYFYKNDYTLFGGDSQVIYVSEEQDAVYGGYYYMYNSGSDGVPLQNVKGDDAHKSVISCFRSKDLSTWERCGAVDDGFAVRFENDQWPVANCWAPETVYNPYDGKYYMYFSAEANPSPDWDAEYEGDTGTTGNMAMFNRFFAAICSSDTPIGPFTLVTGQSYYGSMESTNLNGKIITDKNPAINPKFDLGLDEIFAIIDLHPFFDDKDSDGDGKNDFYLYFVRHISSDTSVNSVWGMKMKDMITPDYSSARMIAKPNYVKVSYNGGQTFNEDSYSLMGMFTEHEVYEAASDKSNIVDMSEYGDEKHINEGPFMWKDGDRYYLTYSPQGVGQIHYQVRQAIGSSPLGEFEKLTLDPATVMGCNDNNSAMQGTGHHSFIDGGNGDLYCVSWPNATPYNYSIDETGRAYAVDRVHFVDDEKYGRIMCGGPTDSLQPKPSSYTGRVNVAPLAKISAENAVEDTVKYLNDEIVVFRPYYEKMEFESKGKTTITLTFDNPTLISAILIYNSYDYYYAFSKIDSILFYLSEKPDWFTAEGYVPVAGISDLPFNSNYYDSSSKYMDQGGAAVASFKDIKVNKIEITVSEKLSDARGASIKLSDIVVLGKGE